MGKRRKKDGTAKPRYLKMIIALKDQSQQGGRGGVDGEVS